MSPADHPLPSAGLVRAGEKTHSGAKRIAGCLDHLGSDLFFPEACDL